jgi:hypothetical protein
LNPFIWHFSLLTYTVQFMVAISMIRYRRLFYPTKLSVQRKILKKITVSIFSAICSLYVLLICFVFKEPNSAPGYIFTPVESIFAGNSYIDDTTMHCGRSLQRNYKWDEIQDQSADLKFTVNKDKLVQGDACVFCHASPKDPTPVKINNKEIDLTSSTKTRLGLTIRSDLKSVEWSCGFNRKKNIKAPVPFSPFTARGRKEMIVSTALPTGVCGGGGRGGIKSKKVAP